MKLKNFVHVSAVAVLVAFCGLVHADQDERGSKNAMSSRAAALYATQVISVKVCGEVADLAPGTLMRSSSAFDYFAAFYIASEGPSGIDGANDALARVISSMQCDAAGVLQLGDHPKS
ncbi:MULTISPECIES: hypothetical protein [Herbaspirillum]|uniref:Rap1a immunity protein domain-containing protein n=1 Tax=Herbaspirillum huttiense TaxID=863372 RepID=A0AAJ2HDS7_9BURK|nr:MULTISPECIES: hypothetical protein [Herbaspirillum]MDR9836910.1 hypothetical protein [Herbaspirillum huttiense]